MHGLSPRFVASALCVSVLQCVCDLPVIWLMECSGAYAGWFGESSSTRRQDTGLKPAFGCKIIHAM